MFAFAINVKIVAKVDDAIITSYDIEKRIEISKIFNPQAFKNVSSQEIKAMILEKMIQEKMLFKMARENNFIISEAELNETISQISSSSNNLKGKNLKSVFGEEGYNSFKEQTKGEIIFNAMLSGMAKEKLNFTKEEIVRFKNTYNQENAKKINDQEAENILKSIKINELQQQIIKNLQESSTIEKFN